MAFCLHLLCTVQCILQIMLNHQFWVLDASSHMVAQNCICRQTNLFHVAVLWIVLVQEACHQLFCVFLFVISISLQRCLLIFWTGNDRNGFFSLAGSWKCKAEESKYFSVWSSSCAVGNQHDFGRWRCSRQHWELFPKVSRFFRPP